MLDITRGAATEEELAALIAVISEAYATEAAAAVADEPSVSAWTRTQRPLRRPLRRDIPWGASPADRRAQLRDAGVSKESDYVCVIREPSASRITQTIVWDPQRPARRRSPSPPRPALCRMGRVHPDSDRNRFPLHATVPSMRREGAVP